MIELAKALLEFQKDPPPVHLDAENPHFHSKFASLGGVISAVRPALTKHGLVVTQLPNLLDGQSVLETRLIHAESGEMIYSYMPLLAAKQDPQAQGSALTYARRYALLSILGLVADADDDGNGAQRARTPEPQSIAARNDTQGLQASRADASVPVAEMIVPFGKHKDKPIKDVPRDYWDWWLAQDSDKFPEIRAAVELHLGLTAQPVGAGGGSDDTDGIPF